MTFQSSRFFEFFLIFCNSYILQCALCLRNTKWMPKSCKYWNENLRWNKTLTSRCCSYYVGLIKKIRRAILITTLKNWNVIDIKFWWFIYFVTKLERKQTTMCSLLRHFKFSVILRSCAKNIGKIAQVKKML